MGSAAADASAAAADAAADAARELAAAGAPRRHDVVVRLRRDAAGLRERHARDADGVQPHGVARRLVAGNEARGHALTFNPMASPGASSPAMKPADMPMAMYRPDSAAPPGMPQPISGALVVSVSGSGGELVKKKRGRPRKYGPDGTLGSAVKAEAGGQSGGAGSNSNPDGKRRGRPRDLAKRNSSMP
ncbi:AT-hook motif nuclear-localized protein 10-like [Hordeum vulgare]|nr:AT-hook motif nuclear-localized protein 10-like [Hordeum vulgare]